MPIYEYECPKCGHFEVVQKVSEKALKAKPDCQEAKCPCAAKRLISASAFHLKGSGWYKTDYAKGGGAKGESASKVAKSDKTEKSDTTKSDTSKSETTKKADGGGSGGSSGGGCGSGCGCH